MEKGGRVAKAGDFLKEGIWKVRLQDHRGSTRFLLRYLRIVLIAGERFSADRCTLWASSLTYYSVLSIVPVFALGFAVAKGFGLQQYLEKMVLEQFAGQEEVILRVVDFSRNLMERTSGGVIAGVGAIFLVWTVFQVLGSAERAFNTVWGVRKGRSPGRKLTDYLSIMLVSPLVIVASSSAMVLLATRLNDLLARFGLGLLAPVITLALGVVPTLLIWMLLTFIYVFLTNARVSLLSGLVGGVLAGTVFVLVQWVYIRFQVGVAGYNAIYGSFAALPLFIVWMNLSWLIVLFGVELVYAHQNQEAYACDHVADRISHSFRTLVSLQAAHLLVKNFQQGGPPLRPSGIASALGLPLRLVTEVLDSLLDAGLAVGVAMDDPERKAYQPAKAIDVYTIAYVIEALESFGVSDILVPRTQSLERISESLRSFSELVEGSDANVKLKDV
ncbi:MAG TPA: YihY/virulence factor BrkB family protein [Deltaproteobacteria bacterium]|nr:YihY/virulence factor BrkB family protein [Deltaproteobacteria bacterium]